MARKKQTKDACTFCRREMSKGGLSKHLSSCEKRTAAMAAADQGAGSKESLIHLQVQDRYNSDFWLHLEVQGSASLIELDNYLRGIWLECCGHMSMFSVGGWGGEELAMQRRMLRMFKPGVEVEHIYDFGTSSHTIVKAVGVRKGRPLTKKPIHLMARNEFPEEACMECGKQAAWFCIECAHEYDQPGLLCEEHAENHPHDDYGPPMFLVNSPGSGMCGYEGPAEPPY